MSNRTPITSAVKERYPSKFSTPKAGIVKSAPSTPKLSVRGKILDDSSNNDRILDTAFSLPSTSARNSAKKPENSASKLRQFSKTPPQKALPKPSLTKTPTNKYPVRPSGLTPTSKPLPFSTQTPKRLIKSTSTQNTPECFTKVSLETPRRTGDRKNLSTVSQSSLNVTKGEIHLPDGEISNLKVAVRVRPLNTQEFLSSNISSVVHVEDNEVVVFAGNTADNSAGVHHRFHYDHVFWSCNSQHRNYSGQEDVFQGIALPLVDKAFEGYNTCLFAYGQTSSGKSYSMMGIDSDDGDFIRSNSEVGIIPRFCHELFKRLDGMRDTVQAEIEVSYFEIYNEKIHDLLAVSNLAGNPPSAKKSLRVREHSIWGPYVVDLSTHPVDSHSALRNWLALGNSQRATAATGMNDKSSRSHSIFNIVLNLTEKSFNGNETKAGQTKRSKISLVDLAGSERVSFTGASGERLKEGVSINKSLLTLGKVISSLASGKKGFVPYRESVLTWLLRENLGGNSRTVMLATISPASIHVDETLATLRYACQARTIVNRVKVNEDPHDKIIRELRMEVERLQAMQQEFERQTRRNSLEPRKIIIETSVDDSEIEALKDQLIESKQELAKAERSWMDRLKEAESVRRTEMRMLKRKGLALEFSAEQKQACLVNLTADPMLSGTLLYLIPPGMVKVGRMRPKAFEQPDIVLEGPLVAFEHCFFENINDRLYITPDTKDFETYVNGSLILKRTQLFDGDRLVIGGSHYFRISNPKCEKRRQNQNPIDFQLAHQEILSQQEKKLREELELEKRAALQQIEASQRANERKLEERLQNLEIERFQVKCSKEMLENELKFLKTQSSSPPSPYQPSKKSSNWEDIIKQFSHPTKESLHSIQMAVKEATQRCKELGLKNIEFVQTQKVDSFGLFHAVVNIIDRENSKMAEWTPSRLELWLNSAQESDYDDKKLIDSLHLDEMVPLEDDFLNDSLNSSKISLNLSAMKDQIFMTEKTKSPLIKSALKNSSSKNTKKDQYPVGKALNFDENCETPSPRSCSVLKESNSNEKNPKTKKINSAKEQLKELQLGTHRLKKLLKREIDEDQRKTVLHSVSEIEHELSQIKEILNQNENAREPVKTPKNVRFLLD